MQFHAIFGKLIKIVIKQSSDCSVYLLKKIDTILYVYVFYNRICIVYFPLIVVYVSLYSIYGIRYTIYDIFVYRIHY